MKTVIIFNISILLWLTQFAISFPIDNCNQNFLITNHCNAEQVPNFDLCTCIECKDVCNPSIPNTECAIQHKVQRCLNYTDGPSLGEQNRPLYSLLEEKNNDKKNDEFDYGKSNAS